MRGVGSRQPGKGALNDDGYFYADSIDGSVSFSADGDDYYYDEPLSGQIVDKPYFAAPPQISPGRYGGKYPKKAASGCSNCDLLVQAVQVRVLKLDCLSESLNNR